MSDEIAGSNGNEVAPVKKQVVEVTSQEGNHARLVEISSELKKIADSQGSQEALAQFANGEVGEPQPEALKSYDEKVFADFNDGAQTLINAVIKEIPEDEYRDAQSKVQAGLETGITVLKTDPEKFGEAAKFFGKVVSANNSEVSERAALMLFENADAIFTHLEGPDTASAISLLASLAGNLPKEVGNELAGKIITQKDKLDGLIGGPNTLSALKLLTDKFSDPDILSLRNDLVRRHLDEIVEKISEGDMDASENYIDILNASLQGDPELEKKYILILKDKMGLLKKGLVEKGFPFDSHLLLLIKEGGDAQLSADILDFLASDQDSQNSRFVDSAVYIANKVLFNYDLINDVEIKARTYKVLDLYVDKMLADFSTGKIWTMDNFISGCNEENKEKVFAHVREKLCSVNDPNMVIDYINLFKSGGEFVKRSRENALEILFENSSLIKEAFTNPDVRTRLEEVQKMGVFRNAVSTLALRGDWDQASPAIEILLKETDINPDEFFASFGVDPKDFLDAWRVASVDAFKTFSENKIALQNLEAQRPGIIKTLSKEFGIKNFGRYPEDLLIKQFDQKEQEGRFGVASFPRLDHGSAFGNENNRKTISEMASKLGDEYKIRITEVGSIFDLVKKLSQLHSRYGKMAFGMIGAHGAKDEMQFDWEDKNELWTNNVLKSPSAPRLHDYFEDGATLILRSCSTGTEDGIGQAISKSLGMKVIAPDSVSFGIEKFNIIEGASRNLPPSFEIEFGSANAQIYQQGVLERSGE